MSVRIQLIMVHVYVSENTFVFIYKMYLFNVLTLNIGTLYFLTMLVSKFDPYLLYRLLMLYLCWMSGKQ